MKKINNYLTITMVSLSLVLLVILWFLLSTYSYFNEYIIPIIMLSFWVIVIWIMYLCYFFFHKRIYLVLIILSLLFIIFSMVKWILYERKVNNLNIDMIKNEVENLYWTWTSGLWFWSNGLWVSNCLKCNWSSYQFFYKLEWNLWYSHLEDSYHVCYINDIVCDFDRMGL